MASPDERGDRDPFVTVFRGSQAEIAAIQVVLESQGFHPFVLSQFTKTIDPFITGGNVFELDLQVPAGEALEVRDALEELRGAPSEGEAPPSGEPDGDEALAAVDLESLGRRLRWGAVLVLFIAGSLALVNVIPLVLGGLTYGYFGVDYVLESRRAEETPPGHEWNLGFIITTLVLCVLIIIASLARTALTPDRW